MYVRVADLEKAGLDKEIPHAARLVHVDLDEVARLASAQLPAAPRVLAHERFLDDEIWFGKDTQLRTEKLLLWSEQVQRRAVREVERGSCNIACGTQKSIYYADVLGARA